MPASWLYQINADGLLVTPDIMERVRDGDRASLRAINRQPLTKLYRANYARPRRDDAIGLFWADVPPLEHIPFVRGRHSPAAWLRDYVTYANDGMTKRESNRASRLLRGVKRDLSPDEGLSVHWSDNGRKVVAATLKPNPKFDLVVVNRYDRAALLKLLGELEASASVPRWIADRTTRRGATSASVLHADYVSWCERESEAAAGIKGFAQELVATGVAKLPRSAGGARYELDLR